jgi:hypothetical protein
VGTRSCRRGSTAAAGSNPTPSSMTSITQFQSLSRTTTWQPVPSACQTALLHTSVSAISMSTRLASSTASAFRASPTKCRTCPTDMGVRGRSTSMMRSCPPVTERGLSCEGRVRWSSAADGQVSGGELIAAWSFMLSDESIRWQALARRSSPLLARYPAGQRPHSLAVDAPRATGPRNRIPDSPAAGQTVGVASPAWMQPASMAPCERGRPVAGGGGTARPEPLVSRRARRGRHRHWLAIGQVTQILNEAGVDLAGPGRSRFRRLTRRASLRVKTPSATFVKGSTRTFGGVCGSMAEAVPKPRAWRGR